MRIVRFKRGQIWWYKNGGTPDGDTYIQGKTRPVIIISNDLANMHSNCLLAIPVTTQIKKDMPTHTQFRMNGNNCTALSENLMSVNTSKLVEYIGAVDNELLSKLEENLLVALGINTEEIIEDNDENCEEITEEFIDKTLEIIKPIIEPVKPKPRGKASLYSSLESKIKYVTDYNLHGIDYMVKEYNEVSKAAVTNKIYRFKKVIEKEANK